MEHPYKIEYLSTPRVKDKGISPVDGVALAKDLEALLLEYVAKGYELVETKSINAYVPGLGTGSDTTGLIVIFKLKDSK